MIRKERGFVGRVGSIWIALAALAALGNARAYGGEFTFPYQKIIETGDTVKLSVVCPVGNVEIRADDVPQIVIDGVRRIRAASKDEATEAAEDVQIAVRQEKGKVTITADMLELDRQDKSFLKKLLGGRIESHASVDLVVTVPVYCDVSVDNAAGNIMVAETRGSVTIKSSSGTISLSGIQGAIDVDNTNGSTTGDLLFGPITIRQATGKIALQWIEGDLRIKSNSADIEVKQERGALDLMTGSGNVKIQTNLESNRDYFVETQSGNIELRIPEESAGTLKIASETGDIRTEVPVTVKSVSKKQMVGEMGSGGVKITLTSTSGDVSVAQF
jgi:DUF4097 and DUF4098 domain-containing protein YvlB